MSNFIYYEKLEDYEKQVRKAKLCDKKDKEIERLNKLCDRYRKQVHRFCGEKLTYKHEVKRLNNIIEWQQNKIAKLNSENVCLKAKIELYENGYILDKESEKE